LKKFLLALTFLVTSFLIANEDKLITIIGTTNVHGEIDPCG